jgi:F0F1-type ATP synthase assembly protein I
MVSKAKSLPVMVRQVASTSLIAAFIVCFFGEIFQNWQIAYSLLLGIFLWMLPNGYFAIRLFRHLGTVPAATLLGIFYRAEIIKLLLSGFFFVMIIKFLSLNMPAFLAGYLVAQLIFFVRLSSRFKQCGIS